MTVPLHLRITEDNIPRNVPYLSISDSDLSSWRNRVESAANGRYRIGICWAGNRRNRNDSRRSCPPEFFNILGEAQHCAFFSLQKSQPIDVGRPSELQLIDQTHLLNDLADTAALIANLDLMISVDTAIAHLAGAMGKPVWILLPYFPDWRWQWDRIDSPWYPSTRLFRQPKPGDWLDVLQQVVTALRSPLPLGEA